MLGQVISGYVRIGWVSTGEVDLVQVRPDYQDKPGSFRLNQVNPFKSGEFMLAQVNSY